MTGARPFATPAYLALRQRGNVNAKAPPEEPHPLTARPVVPFCTKSDATPQPLLGMSIAETSVVILDGPPSFLMS